MDIDDAPVELIRRRDAYCASRGLLPYEMIGFGGDVVVWKTDADVVLKVHRYHREFGQELAVYLKLKARGVLRLRGYAIPILLHHDKDLRA